MSDSAGNVLFSGNIWIFPFITKQPTKRSSANRTAGTIETKPVASIGKDTCWSFLIDKVLLAIVQKWPDVDMNSPIYTQQDNARTHVDPSDEDFRSVVSWLGLNVHLTCQPPNSPDLNILDLGFFCCNSIFALQAGFQNSWWLNQRNWKCIWYVFIYQSEPYFSYSTAVYG